MMAYKLRRQCLLLDTYEEALKVGAGLMDGTLQGEPGPYLIWQVFGRLEGIGKIPAVAEDTLKKEGVINV